MLRIFLVNFFYSRWLTLLFGGIGFVLTVIITRKWWLDRQAKFREEELKRKLDASRKERRQNARTGDEIPENERCVVCRYVFILYTLFLKMYLCFKQRNLG